MTTGIENIILRMTQELQISSFNQLIYMKMKHGIMLFVIKKCVKCLQWVPTLSEPVNSHDISYKIIIQNVAPENVLE